MVLFKAELRQILTILALQFYWPNLLVIMSHMLQASGCVEVFTARTLCLPSVPKRPAHMEPSPSSHHFLGEKLFDCFYNL